MDWQSGRRSDNVEDVRGGGSPAPRGPRRGAAMGGGMVLLVVVVGALMGKSPGEIIQLVGNVQQQQAQMPAPQQQVPQAQGVNDTGKEFVRSVLASTEDVWGKIFAGSGEKYPQPKLVLFRDGVDSACGFTESAVGPFYCPGDQKVYLDLGFFEELARRFKAPGDFAQAYVIAHEIGHHIQNITGTEEKVRAAQRGLSDVEKNQYSVLMELQADCYAGVWAHHAQAQRPFLQEGDVEEALGAATAIGDDTLQKQARGRVVPEAFTHGSSAQRVKWFATGFKSGSIKGCDTFQ
jgi:uncharacterized protein